MGSGSSGIELNEIFAEQNRAKSRFDGKAARYNYFDSFFVALFPLATGGGTSIRTKCSSPRSSNSHCT